MRKYLRELRKDKGFTQRDMAEKIGVTEAYYNMVERGHRAKTMKMSLLQNLAEALGVDVEMFFSKEREWEKEGKA